MSHSRRKYSAEGKREAVALALQPDSSIAEVARNLGINSGNLHRWIKEYQSPNTSAFTGHGNPRDEELAKLKRELAQVKKERDFLREAAVDSNDHCNSSTNILICMSTFDETSKANFYTGRKRSCL